MKKFSAEELRLLSEHSTEQLTKEIMETDDITKILENKKFFEPKRTLSTELNCLLQQKNLKKSKVIELSGINVTYGYEIFRGSKENPSRNHILALALAMKLDLAQTQRLLKLSDNGGLYPCIERDSVIMFAIDKKMSLDQADELLCENKFETISDIK